MKHLYNNFFTHSFCGLDPQDIEITSAPSSADCPECLAQWRGLVKKTMVARTLVHEGDDQSEGTQREN